MYGSNADRYKPAPNSSNHLSLIGEILTVDKMKRAPGRMPFLHFSSPLSYSDHL